MKSEIKEEKLLPVEGRLEEAKLYIYDLIRNYGKHDIFLISERGIAEQFSISRQIVREFFISLEADGLLKREPQKGYRLIDYSATDLDIMRKIRFTIEYEAAKQAVEKMTMEDEIALMVVLRKMRCAKEEKSMLEYAALDREFHKTLVNASHENLLISMYRFLLIPMFPKPKNTDLEDTSNAHEQIFDAMIAKDLAKLEELFNRHGYELKTKDANA